MLRNSGHDDVPISRRCWYPFQCLSSGYMKWILFRCPYFVTLTLGSLVMMIFEIFVIRLKEENI